MMYHWLQIDRRLRLYVAAAFLGTLAPNAVAWQDEVVQPRVNDEASEGAGLEQDRADQSPFENPAENPGESPSLVERERLAGEWGGERARLEELGLTLGGRAVAEITGVVAGGVRRDVSYRNSLQLDAAFNIARVWKGLGGSAYVRFTSVNGESGGSRDAGDAQVSSNLESPRHLTTIDELWYERTWHESRFRLKVGKVDANSEFAGVAAASEFAHSSAGFSPTIFVLPSYPDPSTSVNVFVQPYRDESLTLTLGYGLYDGATAAEGLRTGSRGPSTFLTGQQSSDLFHIVQATWSWAGLSGDHNAGLGGSVSAGIWAHTGRFTAFDGRRETGTEGGYITIEQTVVGSVSSDDDGAGPSVNVFMQYGWADEEVSPFSRHVSAGVVSSGFFASRVEDSAGLYVSFAELSDASGAPFSGDETAINTYYRFRVSPAIYVQPEVQWIFNPGGNSMIDDAVVLGVRAGLEF